MLQPLLTAALLLLPGFQEPPEPVEVPVEAPSEAETTAPVQEPAAEAPVQEPAANSEEAVALLRAIAAAQAPNSEGTQVDGFHMEMVLRDFAADGTREIGLFVTYSVRPQETVELSLDDNGVMVKKGFDGQSYWLQEDGATERLDLGGHEFKQDRESIEQVLDMCADLMLLLDAEQLQQKCSGLTLYAAGAATADRRIGGTLNATAGSWEFSMFVPADSKEPRAFWLYHRNPEPQPEGEPGDWEPTVDTQRFELRAWNDFRGRRAPQVIDIYDTLRKIDAETDEEVLPIRTLELHDVRWMLSPKPAAADSSEN